MKNTAGGNVFKAHDDKHKDEYPVHHWLRCCKCGRTKLIRTVSLGALRRTARRAGWRWIVWPVDYPIKGMTCKACVAKPQNERADNG